MKPADTDDELPSGNENLAKYFSQFEAIYAQTMQEFFGCSTNPGGGANLCVNWGQADNTLRALKAEVDQSVLVDSVTHGGRPFRSSELKAFHPAPIKEEIYAACRYGASNAQMVEAIALLRQLKKMKEDPPHLHGNCATPPFYILKSQEEMKPLGKEKPPKPSKSTHKTVIETHRASTSAADKLGSKKQKKTLEAIEDLKKTTHSSITIKTLKGKAGKVKEGQKRSEVEKVGVSVLPQKTHPTTTIKAMKDKGGQEKDGGQRVSDIEEKGTVRKKPSKEKIISKDRVVAQLTGPGKKRKAWSSPERTFPTLIPPATTSDNDVMVLSELDTKNKKVKYSAGFASIAVQTDDLPVSPFAVPPATVVIHERSGNGKQRREQLQNNDEEEEDKEAVEQEAVLKERRGCDLNALIALLASANDDSSNEEVESSMQRQQSQNLMSDRASELSVAVTMVLLAYQEEIKQAREAKDKTINELTERLREKENMISEREGNIKEMNKAQMEQEKLIGELNEKVKMLANANEERRAEIKRLQKQVTDKDEEKTLAIFQVHDNLMDELHMWSATVTDTCNRIILQQQQGS